MARRKIFASGSSVPVRARAWRAPKPAMPIFERPTTRSLIPYLAPTIFRKDMDNLIYRNQRVDELSSDGRRRGHK